VPDETEERGTGQGASATSPVTVILKGNVPEQTKRRTDWVALASSAPAVLGFLGLIVYAVVRVGHDAFYARFGVTAEEVGLSQATILGRAALYFVFFLTAAIALLGVAAVIARPTAAMGAVRRKKNEEGGSEPESGAFWARVGVGFLVLVAGLAGVIVAGLESSWPLALAISLVIPLALVASRAGRLSKGHRAAVGLLFGLLAAWSAAVAFLVANRGPESSPGAGSFSAPSRWLLFAFCALAVALASVSLLRQFETNSTGAEGGRTEGDGTESERQQIYRTMLSLLALLPLALAFFAPGVARFVTDASDRTAAAVAMWAVLFGFVILGFQALPGSKPDERASVVDILLIVSLASVFAGTALYLASLRGLDLANQVLAGNRLTQSGFGMFSVRADIVCLESLNGSNAAKGLPEAPVIYLGQSANNELVLFDLERREEVRAREEEVDKRNIFAPQRVPLRIPAADVMVRVANLVNRYEKYVVPVTLKKAHLHFDGKWKCLGEG
jgi:hypothetical protein